jgi:hypothetical protein
VGDNEAVRGQQDEKDRHSVGKTDLNFVHDLTFPA